MTESQATKPKPMSHRKPDLTTVRQLYGTAFRCGKPGCGKPLYTMNNDTGEILLNSQLAHICARSEGGPRWDPEMSEAENRSAANLIPLCLDHAREIDITPEHYPAELIREWKRTQIAEHFKMQKAWPLTDDEAQEVIEASFEEYGAASASAASVNAAVRAAGHLAETSRQQRQMPAEAASAWQAMRAAVGRSMPRAWDAETGDLLPPVEPAYVETKPYADDLDQTLRQAVINLRPLAAVLLAELHAVRTAFPRVTRWCDWVETATATVLNAAGTWPGRPPENDDHVHAEAIAELLRASSALHAAWRGQPAEQPPEPISPAPEPVETDTQRRFRQHAELLDRARPWARVSRRPYDAALYADLVQAARFAVGLPKLLTFLGVDLAATTRLAAGVARNADDATLADLIDAAATEQPLAVAVYLIRDLMFLARQTQRPELETKALHYATRLLHDADWADQTVWVDNRYHVRSIFAWTASVSTDEEVGERITEALAGQPELMEPIIMGISTHSEQHDRDGGVRINVYVEELPPWFPTPVVAAEIRRRYPNLRAISRGDCGEDEDETERLAAQILHIDTSSV